MLYTIQNDFLRVTVNSRGAELWSIQTQDGTEYLWQGDPKYWSDRALNLFPHIGLCTNGVYTYAGQTYHLDAHGFVKDSELALERRTDMDLVFCLTDTPATREMYPFSFRYTLHYRLEGRTIHVCIGGGRPSGLQRAAGGGAFL